MAQNYAVARLPASRDLQPGLPSWNGCATSAAFFPYAAAEIFLRCGIIRRFPEYAAAEWKLENSLIGFLQIGQPWRAFKNDPTIRRGQNL
jgi:hypothetical protein